MACQVKVTVVVVLSKTALADGDSRTGGDNGWVPPPGFDVVTVTTLAVPTPLTVPVTVLTPAAKPVTVTVQLREPVRTTQLLAPIVRAAGLPFEMGMAKFDVAAVFKVKTMLAELLTRMVVAEGLTDAML